MQKAKSSCCGAEIKRKERPCYCANESTNFCELVHHGFYNYCQKCLKDCQLNLSKKLKSTKK